MAKLGSAAKANHQANIAKTKQMKEIELFNQFINGESAINIDGKTLHIIALKEHFNDAIKNLDKETLKRLDENSLNKLSDYFNGKASVADFFEVIKDHGGFNTASLLKLSKNIPNGLEQFMSKLDITNLANDLEEAKYENYVGSDEYENLKEEFATCVNDKVKELIKGNEDAKTSSLYSLLQDYSSASASTIKDICPSLDFAKLESLHPQENHFEAFANSALSYDKDAAVDALNFQSDCGSKTIFSDPQDCSTSVQSSFDYNGENYYCCA